ncbi:MAG: hypothetical protein KJN63_12110 [Acidimicrobiia bacterium]|nr:hypothetical protein [Acidimicrobiia bacterium]
MLARAHRTNERGVLVAAFGLWLSAAVLCCLLVLGVANRASERAAAQSAADAAALAGAAEGPEAANRIATANKAIVVLFERDGPRVFVRVERNGVAAEAVAEKQIRLAD